MNLLKFVCSFVWTDLRVTQAERDLVMRIAGYLHLTDDEVRQVKKWLAVPPREEEVDPTTVPRKHRELFLEAAKLAVEADGRVVPAERDSIALFRDLVAR
jgi:hypothetical protein